VFNRKIVRRIAFQYWIAFKVALEEGCKIPDLVLVKDFFSMLIINLKMRSATNTDIIFIPYIGMYCNWLCNFLLASWLYYPIVGEYLRIYCTCDSSILGVGYTWRIN